MVHGAVGKEEESKRSGSVGTVSCAQLNAESYWALVAQRLDWAAVSYTNLEERLSVLERASLAEISRNFSVSTNLRNRRYPIPLNTPPCYPWAILNREALLLTAATSTRSVVYLY